MVDLPAITGAVNALKSIKDLAESMIALRDGKALDAKRLEFQSKMIDAQGIIFAINEERSALIEEVRGLKKQIAELETWSAEKQRYELKVVSLGATTYALKDGVEPAEQPHWLCAACYQNGKKSILQAAGPAALQGPEYRKTIWRCPACKAEIRVPFNASPSTPAHRSEM